MNFMKIVEKSSIKLLSELSEDDRTNFFQVAYSFIYNPLEDHSKTVNKIGNEKKLCTNEIYNILSCFIGIVQLFRDNPKQDFYSKLVECGFPNSFIESLPVMKATLGENYFNSPTDHFQDITDVTWRIDISLTNSSLEGKVLPHVILLFYLKNRQSYIIEVDGKSFHKLRFNIALILKEINSLKKIFNK